MSLILRCDAPGCTQKATTWGTLPAGWTMTHNRYGDVVHACASPGHVTSAQNTATRVAISTIV